MNRPVPSLEWGDLCETNQQLLFRISADVRSANIRKQPYLAESALTGEGLAEMCRKNTEFVL
jgi:hypothetical protein